MTVQKPKRSLGQNFLIDDNIAKKLINCANLTCNDVVLEIGPGRGALTALIAPKVKHLIAVELDRTLATGLKKTFNNNKNVKIINADFILLDIAQHCKHGTKIRIIGNIPYNLSGPIIFKVLDNYMRVEDMLLMLQKEVAHRIVAKPRTKDYGLLSIFNQAVADPKILFDVSPHVFRPRPKVSSSVVHWVFPEEPKYYVKDRALFRTVLRTAFSQRRKTMRNSLREMLPENMTDCMVLSKRPEELTVKELIKLCEDIATYECQNGAF